MCPLILPRGATDYQPMKRLFTLLFALGLHSLGQAQTDSTIFGLARTSSPPAIYLASINPTTGTVSNISSTSVGISFTLAGSTIDPYNKIFYYISEGKFIGLDMQSGTLLSDPVISNPNGDYFDQFVFNCADSTIYGLARTSNAVYLATIDPVTGTVSNISSNSLGLYISLNAGSTIDPINNIFYYSPGAQLIGVDMITGQIVSSPAIGFANGYFDGMQYHPGDGVVYGLARTNSPAAIYLASIDPATGTVNTISNTSIGTVMTLTGTTLDPDQEQFYFAGNGDFRALDLNTGTLLSSPILSNTNGVYFDGFKYYDPTCVAAPPTTSYVVVSDSFHICQGDSLLIGGNYRTSEGTYQDTIAGSGNVDTILVSSLFVHDTTSHVISGTIFFQGQAITSGEVVLIQDNGVGSQNFSFVDSMMVNPDGTYLFDSIGSGTYLIQALGDQMLYNNVPTYADSSFDWQLAQMLSFPGGCKDTLSGVDVSLISIANSIGSGTINGRLTIGNPVSGLAMPDYMLMLEDLTDNSISQIALSGPDGLFAFDNIPNGHYRIYVDQLGYLVDSLNTFLINGQNSSFETNVCMHTDLRFVEICSKRLTSIDKGFQGQIELFPNPFASSFQLRWEDSRIPIRYQILSSTGVVIREREEVNQSQTSIDLSEHANGIYLIQLAQGEKRAVFKLMKQ